MYMSDLPEVIQLLSWIILPLCLTLAVIKKDMMIAILGVPLALIGLVIGYIG